MGTILFVPYLDSERVLISGVYGEFPIVEFPPHVEKNAIVIVEV